MKELLSQPSKVEFTDSDRASKLAKIKDQQLEEKNLQQERNLLLLTLNIENEIKNRLKKHADKAKERKMFMNDKQLKNEELMTI